MADYSIGIAVQDRTTFQVTVDEAAAAVEKADARLARTRRVSQRIRDAINMMKDAATPADILAELEVEELLQAAEEDSAHKKMSLAQARAKLEVYEKSTVPTMIKRLKNDVARARAEEAAKLAAWDLEKAKAEKLMRQIENCNLYAPGDGVVVHANDRRHAPFLDRVTIANGATIRERQLIFKMPDLKSPLRVVSHVPDWSIHNVKRGVKAARHDRPRRRARPDRNCERGHATARPDEHVCEPQCLHDSLTAR